MKQLVLDIRLDAPPDFTNFVTGTNDAVIAALQDAVQGASHVYLWGSPSSGRTHLLRATVARSMAAGRVACFIAATEVGESLPQDPLMLIAIDDIEHLSDRAQIAVFNAFNRAIENRQTLLISGPCPPLGLKLREDLRTRLGQCLIHEVRQLDDIARTEILAMLADRRGLRLGDDVISFILNHGRRDLGSLVSIIDVLDQCSLESKRAITLPMLRKLMQTGLQL